jgi:hypothetical protein
MALERNDVFAIITASVRDYLRELGTEAPEIGAQTELIGGKTLLDSAGLVSVIMEVELRLQEQHNVEVSLANEKAFSQRTSPFLTVGALADYAHRIASQGPEGGNEG